MHNVGSNAWLTYESQVLAYRASLLLSLGLRVTSSSTNTQRQLAYAHELLPSITTVRWIKWKMTTMLMASNCYCTTPEAVLCWTLLVTRQSWKKLQ